MHELQKILVFQHSHVIFTEFFPDPWQVFSFNVQLIKVRLNTSLFFPQHLFDSLLQQIENEFHNFPIGLYLPIFLLESGYHLFVF